MKIEKTYAVFGLGRYGRAVASELVRSGAEVIAVDINESNVNDAITDIPYCKCADVTDIEVIKQLGIANIDTVIIAMANHLEATVMATMLCKEVGVNTVIAKCGNDLHYKLLLKVGADKVVFPERESGVRLAKNLLSSDFIDLLELSKGVSMIELSVRDDWAGKTLLELNLRRRYTINIVAIREGDQLVTSINPEVALNKNMKLIVIMNTAMLEKLK